MKQNFVFYAVLALGSALMSGAQAGAQTPTKVGIIQLQNAILSTKDGQKAAKDLEAKFAPTKADIERKQNMITQLQDQLRKGSNTMSDEAKQKLMRDIDENTKQLNRATEDAQSELDQEQNKIWQQLGQRMMAVIDKYARDNGYALVLDVSSQQSPVLYAAESINITNDIIALYDKNSPSAAPASSSAPAGTSTPKPVTPGPAAKPAISSAAPKPAAPSAAAQKK